MVHGELLTGAQRTPSPCYCLKCKYSNAGRNSSAYLLALADRLLYGDHNKVPALHVAIPAVLQHVLDMTSVYGVLWNKRKHISCIFQQQQKYPTPTILKLQIKNTTPTHTTMLCSFPPMGMLGFSTLSPPRPHPPFSAFPGF
jgi:hypothetical protein